MAKISPEKAADNELGFFIKWLNPRSGKPPFSKQQIADRFFKISGKRITRQTVERYLRPDIKRRTPPFFGTGLVLCQTLAQMHHEYLIKEEGNLRLLIQRQNQPAKAIKTRKAPTRGKSKKKGKK